MRTLRLPLVLLWAAGCAGVDPSASTEEVVLGRTVIEVPDNPRCSDRGYEFGFKIDMPASSDTFVIDAAGNTITVTFDDPYVTWSSSIGIDEVIVKGGPTALIYVYSPESFGDEGLVTPTNPNNGEPYGLSHVDFCFDYEVTVAKTATTSLTRTYPWTLDKTSTFTSVVLATGEQLLVPYDVAVALGTPVDSDWAVGGEVTIHNPAPMAATLTGIVDHVGEVEVTLDCGVTLPYELATNATLVCSYSLPLEAPVAGVNTAEVTTTGTVGGGSASATFDFTAPTVHPVDDCITVTDDHAGLLGTVCVPEAPVTLHYTILVGPYEACGEYQVVNVASFVTDDTGATGSDSWTLGVSVPCAGCTLTPGYWKTHSSHGPAPYDDAWALLPGGEGADTEFFGSGLTYHEVLWTAPVGNAYFILAHAYIGAELNVLNGAGLGAAHDAFDQATALFNAYTPEAIAALKGRAATTLRATFIALAGTLDGFNNGLIGPGHCNE